ncbi:MAG: gephyrin-like molybdotransferase Glp [Nitrososphaerales archaeon]
MSHRHDIGFSKLLAIDDALRKFFSYKVLNRVPEERVPIISSIDRILASKLISQTDLPPYDRSAVDGFALKADDTSSCSKDNPVLLTIVDVVEIGTTPKVPVGKLEAVRISTGAPTSEGSDAVVMIEHAERQNGKVKIFNPISAGKNVIRKGEDVRVGEVLLDEGSKIMPQDVGMFSALSFRSIKVVRKPRVAILSVGDELLEAGSQQVYGKTVDINRPALISTLLQDGCEPVDLGIVKDDFDIVKERVLKGMSSNDMLLIGGGTSVGTKDIVPEVIDSLGEPGIVAHGLAMRPGKPTGLAIVNKKPIILVPGYPVAALIAYGTFAKPIIGKFLGSESVRNRGDIVQATLTEKLDSSLGIREYVRVVVVGKQEGFSAKPITASGAAILSSMVKTNGVLTVPEGVESIMQNEQVEIRLIRPL